MPRFLHPLTDLLEMLPHEDDALRPSADELFRLARILDERGMTKEADRITDSMVRTAAYEGAGWGGTGQYQMTPQAQPQGGYGMQQGYGGGYAQPQQNPLNDPIGRSISYMNAVKAAQQAQQSNNPEAYQQAYQRAAQAWGMMGEGEQAGMAKNYETGGSQAGNAAQAGSWQVAQPQAYKGINGQMQQPSPFEVARAQAWQAYYNGDQEGYQQAYQQAQQAFSSMPRGQQQAYWQTQANWRPQVSFQAANQPQQTPNQQTRSLITPQGTSQVPQPQQARSLITPSGDIPDPDSNGKPTSQGRQPGPRKQERIR